MRKAITRQKYWLLEDGKARAAASLGEVKLTAARPDGITAEDLEPTNLPSGRALGSNPTYGKRTGAAGLTAEALLAPASTPAPSGVAQPVMTES